MPTVHTTSGMTNRRCALLLVLTFFHSAAASAYSSATWVYMPAWTGSMTTAEVAYRNVSTVNFTGVSHALYAFADFDPPNYVLTYPFGNDGDER